MTTYHITAWCDRPFYARCEVDAATPEEALAKAREAIHDAPAEECDQGYYWDEWRVDTAETEGVLHHLDESARMRVAAPNMLSALKGLLDAIRCLPVTILTGPFYDALCAAEKAVAEAEGRAA